MNQSKNSMSGKDERLARIAKEQARADKMSMVAKGIKVRKGPRSWVN